MHPRFNNPTPIEELHSSSNKDLAVSCSKKRASSSSRILFERLRLQVEKIRVSLIKRLRSGRRQNGLVPTIGSHLLENHDRHEHFCKTADLVGFAGSSLCAMKCAFLGILMGAGLASSSAGIFYGLTKLVHSPYLVLGLTFVSVISAFKGLLYPMYKHLVHSRMVRNQTAFLTGMAGVASVFFIIGVQMFSGIVLSSLATILPSLDHLGHFSQHDHSFSAIVYDSKGPLGLDENFFVHWIEHFMRTLFFISSVSLAVLHFFNMAFAKKMVKE